MPITTAIYLQNGNWYMQTLAQVEPPFPKLQFAGATQDQQAQAVQRLGNLMRADDSPALLNDIPNLFPNAGSPPQEIFNEAFGWADSMLLPGQTVPITAAEFGEEAVDEAFPDFAELLLAFFGLAVANGSSKRETMRIARVLNRTIPGAANQILSTAGSFVYSMTFQNFSGETFPLDDCSYQMQAGLSTITEQPSGDLIGGGTQSFAWTELLSNIASGDTWADLRFFIPSSSTYIGVKIIAPIQVFDIGPAPYYEVWVNGNWTGDYTSAPYTYTTDTGYSILVTPVAGHTSITINVTINTLSDALKRKLKLPPPKGTRGGLPEPDDATKKVQAEWTKSLASRKSH